MLLVTDRTIARSALMYNTEIGRGLLATVIGPDSHQDLANNTARFGWFKLLMYIILQPKE